MEYPSFETERLRIIPTADSDASFIYKLLNSPKWLKYIGNRNIADVDSARAYIQSKMTPQLEKRGFSNYTVIRKNTLEKIGTCGLYERDYTTQIELGFAFLPEFEQKGFAFEASKRLMEAAFQQFGLKELNAITTQDNWASQGLLKKLGFKLQGSTELPGDPEPLFLFRVSLAPKFNPS